MHTSIRHPFYQTPHPVSIVSLTDGGGGGGGGVCMSALPPLVCNTVIVCMSLLFRKKTLSRSFVAI